MAGSVKGIIVEIGGDTSKLQEALKKVNSQSSSLSKELRGVNSLLKLDPKNVELLGQKQTILNENIQTTQTKLNELKKIKEEADKKMAEGTKISEENYRNLQREIINTEKKLGNLTAELKQFNLENSNWTTAGKKIQEYGENIEKVSGKIDKTGNELTTKLTAPLIGLGTVAITTGASLEKAVDKYIAATGKSIEETEKYKKVLTDINDANFGEGYEDIANSMAIVEQQMRGIDDAADLENITKKAYYLKDAFDSEINESVRAAKMMMEQWGISADEAFELINQGYQKGLDKNGDLLDSINEYSVHFRQIGLSATDMFNTFELGAEKGAFSIDKVGDAIKEMGIRLKDGTATDVLKKMKLNAKELEKAFAEGGEKGADAFGKIVEGLQNIKDPLKQNQAGVAIFGTMWEDLGKDAVFSMTSYAEGFDETAKSLDKSMDKLYSNTESNAQATLKRMKTISADLGTKLLPTINKLIDKAEDFVDCLDGMSDAEKENVVKIGLLVAGIGPLTKAVGTAGQVVGTTAKGIGTFSQAVGVMKNHTESGVASVDNLAKTLTGVTSPAGMATIAITATTAALAYAIYKQKEATKETEEFAEEMKKQKEAYEEYNKNIDKTTASNLAEINSVSKLKDELKTLVDENGKVKEGYKSRVNFILNELNKALGKEYKLNDNIVQNYKELQSEIDKTIEKKKAEIILNADEEKYSEAIKQETEAVKILKTAREELGMSYEKAKEKCDNYHKAVRDGTISADEALANSKDIKNLENKIVAYEQAESTVKTCTENKKKYEENYALFVEGKYDEIGKTVKDTTSNWSDASIQTIKDTITQEKDNLNIYKEIYKKTGDEIAQEQIAQSEQNLKNLANELVARTSTVNNLGTDEIEAWKTLANSSYEEYKNAISKMAPEMQQKIQDTTHVIVSDTGLVYSSSSKAKQLTDIFQRTFKIEEKTKDKLDNTASTINIDTKVKNASKELAKKASAGFNNNINASKWGTDLTDELSKGMLAQKARKKVTDAASTVAGWVSSFLHFSLPEKGPLSDMDKSMPDMINLMANGINQNKSILIKSAEKMARELDNTLVNDIKVSQIRDFGKLQGGLNRQIANSSKITNIDNRNVTFNIQGSNAKEVADEVNRILGRQY